MTATHRLDREFHVDGKADGLRFRFALSGFLDEEEELEGLILDGNDGITALRRLTLVQDNGQGALHAGFAGGRLNGAPLSRLRRAPDYR